MRAGHDLRANVIYIVTKLIKTFVERCFSSLLQWFLVHTKLKMIYIHRSSHYMLTDGKSFGNDQF